MKKIKEFFKEIKKRITSKVVWAGFVAIIGIIVSVSGIDFNTINNWNDFFKTIKLIVSNPGLIASIIVAIYSYFNNPTDKKKF